jgi:hypothetical protein
VYLQIQSTHALSIWKECTIESIKHLTQSVSVTTIETLNDSLHDSLGNVDDAMDAMTSVGEPDMTDEELEAALAELDDTVEPTPSMYLGIEIPSAPTTKPNARRTDGTIRRSGGVGSASVRNRRGTTLVN